jgi:hypothetical protein
MGWFFYKGICKNYTRQRGRVRRNVKLFFSAISSAQCANFFKKNH